MVDNALKTFRILDVRRYHYMEAIQNRGSIFIYLFIFVLFLKSGNTEVKVYESTFLLKI